MPVTINGAASCSSCEHRYAVAPAIGDAPVGDAPVGDAPLPADASGIPADASGIPADASGIPAIAPQLPADPYRDWRLHARGARSALPASTCPPLAPRYANVIQRLSGRRAAPKSHKPAPGQRHGERFNGGADP